MNLHIQIKDGQSINHPAYEDNLIQAFGAVPDDWELFVRVGQPVIGDYEVLESQEPTYKKVDGVWTDVWAFRQMTDEEKSAKQQEIKNLFAGREQAENWSAWIFDEKTGKMQPPIPRPTRDEEKIKNGIYTYWCGAENGWKDSPAYPSDGNKYKFDFIAWQWVLDVN